MRTLKISLLIFILSINMPSQNFWEPVGGPMNVALSNFNVLRDSATYVLGGSYATGDHLFRTTNHGENWENFEPPEGGWDIISDNNGYYYALWFNNIYRSINNGMNWNHIYSATLNLWGDLEIDNTDGIYLFESGNGTRIKKSTDFGNNWSIVYSTNEGQGAFPVFEFTKQGHLYLQLSQLIVRSIDNGSTFEEFSFPNQSLTSLTVNSKGYIFITKSDAGNTQVLKSTNDGNTWEEISIIQNSVYKIYAVSNDDLYCCVYNSGIVKSTDDGTNWEFINEGLVNYTNYDIIEDFAGYLYVTTHGDGIFRSIEPITDISLYETSAISNFLLIQNYPNPFNPCTVIEYQIHDSGFITLKVYDILGNEIVTLINDEKPVGEYEVEFNAAILPSGIYFYQLKAGQFSETKKMVLLK